MTAAWIPNEAIDFIARLIAVLVGLPVSIPKEVRAVRTGIPAGRCALATYPLLPRVLSALSMPIGVGILGWQTYNLVVLRPSELSGIAGSA